VHKSFRINLMPHAAHASDQGTPRAGKYFSGPLVTFAVLSSLASVFIGPVMIFVIHH
jgi:hypothetical protein